MDVQHRLILEQRDATRGHTWQASCACDDWVAVPTRRRAGAEASYREHKREQQPGRSDMHPRRPTPLADLPMELVS